MADPGRPEEKDADSGSAGVQEQVQPSAELPVLHGSEVPETSVAGSLPGSVPPELVSDGRIDLHAALRRLGVSDEEIHGADAAGRLELFALERIVEGSGPRYDIDEVAALAGIESTWVLALWRALGFPEPRPGEEIFSDIDLEMLTDTIPYIAQGGLDTGLALQMTRVIGSSVARIAAAQVDAIASEIEYRRDEAEEAEVELDELDDEVAQRAATLLPMMPKVMEFVWRRHLGHAARRRLLRAEGGRTSLCVGFADLVGFTAQTQQLQARQLAEVVERFEALAHDIVTSHGGRVVKMIGDEVLFCADDARTGGAIALEMARTYGSDPAFSDVRVGMASGEVLERDGDVYGPVVNKASRIVSIAYPGAVVVSQEIADALEDDEALVVRSIRSHYLRDIGRERLFTVRSAEDDAEEPYRRARRRRAAHRQFLLDVRTRRELDAAARTDEVRAVLPDELLEHRQFADEPTDQIEAISEAVLESDLDDDLTRELLTDIEVARRLGELEREASRKADEADLEAEEKIVVAEREARRKVVEAERESRRKIEAALAEAEEKAEQANAEAERKVRRVAKDAERLAQQAEKSAARKAKHKTRKRRDRPSSD